MISYAVSFIVLLIVSLRGILQSDRLVGHNWDFSFPYPTDLFSRIVIFSKYTWLDYQLGFVPILNLSHIVPNSMIAGLGSVTGSVLAVKILLVLVITLSFFSFKRLLDELVSKQLVNYIPSFLYAFSPFLFNEIIGGSWYMWISYAFSPLYLLSTIKIVTERRWSYLWPYIISSFFVISSLQNFACISTISFLYICYIGHTKSSFIQCIKRYLLLHLLLVAINSYWLISFCITFADFSSRVFTGQQFAGGFPGVRNSLQSIIAIMSLGGYLDRSMYLHAMPAWLTQFFNCAFIAAWFAILYSALGVKGGKKRGQKRTFMFWLLILLLSFIVTKGGNIPLPQLTMDIFNRFTPMRLFRSPQHLVFFAAFIVPVLIAFSIDRLREAGHRSGPLFFAVMIGIWVSPWFITGDIGKATLASQKRDHIDLFALSPALSKLYKDDKSDPRDRRVMFLPSVASPIYLKTYYQNPAQGVIPELTYLRNSTFTAEDNIYAKGFEESFCNGKPGNFVPFLSLFSVRDIVVRADIVPAFTECVNRFYVKDIRRLLEREPRLRKVSEGDYLTRYLIKPTYQLLPVFIPRKISVQEESPSSLHALVSKPGYQVSDSFYFAQQNEHRSFLSQLTRTQYISPQIEYKKVSPSKYIVRIHKARGPFPLILSTNFHQLWKVYIAPRNQPHEADGYISQNVNGTVQNNRLPNGHYFDTLTQPVVVSNADHFMANGYANSWIIRPSEICNLSNACKKNSDGTVDINLQIEFSLQKFLIIGYLISGIILVIIAGSYALNRQKNQ